MIPALLFVTESLINHEKVIKKFKLSQIFETIIQFYFILSFSLSVISEVSF